MHTTFLRKLKHRVKKPFKTVLAYGEKACLALPYAEIPGGCVQVTKCPSWLLSGRMANKCILPRGSRTKGAPFSSPQHPLLLRFVTGQSRCPLHTVTALLLGEFGRATKDLCSCQDLGAQCNPSPLSHTVGFPWLGQKHSPTTATLPPSSHSEYCGTEETEGSQSLLFGARILANSNLTSSTDDRSESVGALPTASLQDFRYMDAAKPPALRFPGTFLFSRPETWQIDVM